MRKYLTTFFVCLSILSVVIGFRFEVRWNGIASWGLALIFLIFAAYFTKYISEEKKPKPSCEEKNE